MAKFTLVIGNKNYSSWSLRPWLVLKYFEIPFKEIIIPLFQPESKAALLKYSPGGKVPALQDGTLTIWESIAVIEYIADLYPQKNIWPNNKKARAIARAVSAEMHAGFLNLRKTCPMNVRGNKPQASFADEVIKDIDRICAIWDHCRKKFGKGGPFLFGKFSAADAMFAPVVWRFNTYGISLKSRSQAVRDYFEIMLYLPAMEEWKKAALQETWVIEHH